MPYKDNEAQREYQRQYFQKHKARKLKEERDARKILRDNVNKLKTKCVVCGECENCCLDFHHIEEKDLSISRMVENRRSLVEIHKEIEKCMVVCSNCHRKIHAGKLEVSLQPSKLR